MEVWWRMLISLPLTIGTVSCKAVDIFFFNHLRSTRVIKGFKGIFCFLQEQWGMKWHLHGPVIQLFSPAKATALQAALSNSVAQEAELVSRRLLKWWHTYRSWRFLKISSTANHSLNCDIAALVSTWPDELNWTSWPSELDRRQRGRQLKHLDASTLWCFHTTKAKHLRNRRPETGQRNVVIVVERGTGYHTEPHHSSAVETTYYCIFLFEFDILYSINHYHITVRRCFERSVGW